MIPTFKEMKKLHLTQEKLLKLLKDNIDNPLTIRELGFEIGEDSPGVVYHHLMQLEKKGYLKRNPNNSKDYILMDSPDKKIVYLNKYGTAKCGPGGLILDGSIVDRVPMPSSLLKFPAAEAFIVEAKGDSMEPKIKNGDIIIAHQQNTAEHLDLVVCTYKEEVLIKQFLVANGVLLLSSLNNIKYPPMRVTKQDLKIAGVVKNILHYD
jgi:repressor LexA